MVWLSLTGGVAVGVLAFAQGRSYSVEGSGDVAQVLATLLVAIAVEARVLSRALSIGFIPGFRHGFPFRIASSLLAFLAMTGTGVATSDAMRGQALGRLDGALVLAAVVALLSFVLGTAYFGSVLSDD